MRKEEFLMKVAIKHGVPYNKVEEIFDSDYRTMVEKTKNIDINDESTQHVFLIPNFGKFVTNISRINKIYGRIKRNNEKLTEELP